MTVLRRLVVGVLAFAVMLCASAAQAQVLNQLPADALLVIKLNNPEALSAKLGAWATKLGIAQFEPSFADPLGHLKQQLNIKEGIDAKGEVAFGIYDPGQPDMEPHMVLLLPVTDFKAFLANLANVKPDGDLMTFTMPDQLEPIYTVNWGAYAAITPNKELLAKKPAGMAISGVARKELDSNDLAVYVNVKPLAAKALPELKQNREMILNQMDTALKGNPQMNPQYLPVFKAIVSRALDMAQSALEDGRAATVGLKVTPEGFNFGLVGDFDPTSYAGKFLQRAKKTDASLLTGMPSRNYFFVGGAVGDPKNSVQVISDLVDPIMKELSAIEGNGKKFVEIYEAMKDSMSALESFSFGYAQPTGPLGQQGLMQVVEVFNGNSAKMATGMRKYMDNAGELMSIMPQAPGIQFKMDNKKESKTVEGVKLDQMSVKFEFDRNAPGVAQQGQFIDMLYGADGLNGHMGPVNEKTYMLVMGGDDELLTSSVQAAKKQDTSLSQLPHFKVVSAQLPKNRAAEFYFCVDNLATTVLEFVGMMMGQPMPIKLPPNMPPIGFSVGTEGTAFRVDVHVSGELVEKSVAAGMQAAMMMQQGGRGAPPKRGGL